MLTRLRPACVRLQPAVISFDPTVRAVVLGTGSTGETTLPSQGRPLSVRERIVGDMKFDHRGVWA